MSSIFSGYFIDNLKRIYSSSERRSSAPTAEAREFQAHLESAQTNQGSATSPQGNRHLDSRPPEDARASLRSEPPLSNMTFEERTGELGAYRLSPQFEFHLPPQGGRALVNEGVNSPTTPVTPPSLLPTPRVKEPSSVPPTVPKVVEIVREEIPFLSGISGGKGANQVSKAEIASIVTAAGRYHRVDPNLSLAVAKAESNFNPTAVSRDGYHSKGVFQLLDSTAKEMMKRVDWKSSYEPFDPGLNAHLGVGYLKRLHDLFGKESNLGYNIRTVAVRSPDELEKIAVAAFNAGEGRVAQAQRRAQLRGLDPSQYSDIEQFLPKTTRVYVARVSEFRQQFAQAEGDSKIA